jgi:dUTP pyrophosphatase
MPAQVRVQLLVLPHGQGLPTPTYESSGSSGVDLHAAIDRMVRLRPACRVLVPSGIAIALPRGFEAQVRSRSGLANNLGLIVLNSPGTIDSDYRGEILILLANLGHKTVEIRRGDRIAQLVFAPITYMSFISVESLSATARGVKGLGSSGLRRH